MSWEWNKLLSTWRKWMGSSAWESLSSSSSFFFSSPISLWICSSSFSASPMAVFSWALISSLTSKRFSSIDRISSEKTASLSSAAARAERWRETQRTERQAKSEDQRPKKPSKVDKIANVLNSRKIRHFYHPTVKCWTSALTLREKMAFLSSCTSFSLCWILSWELCLISPSCLWRK